MNRPALCVIQAPSAMGAGVLAMAFWTLKAFRQEVQVHTRFAVLPS